MTLPQRNLVPRRVAAPRPPAPRRPPSHESPGFDEATELGDDTNPHVSTSRWSADLDLDLDPPTDRPPTRAGRPPGVPPPRHATGTPVPAPMPRAAAPQVYQRPAQVAAARPPSVVRRATPSPWESSTGGGGSSGSGSGSLPRASVSTSAPRPAHRAESVSNYELVAPGPAPRRAEPRAEAPASRAPAAGRETSVGRVRRASTPAPQPVPPPRAAAPLPLPQPAASVSAPAPLPPPPVAPPPVPQIELPPELAAPVYGLIRRLALQTELGAADRVLRVGIAELTDATVCVSRFVDAEGQPWALGEQGDAALGAELLAQIAAAGRALCEGHVLVQPIVAAGRTIALLVLTRNERLAGFGLVERAIAMLVARECAGLLHQLLGDHAQKEREAAADQRSLFRPQALESHRAKGNEGALMNLSPIWVRRAYPVAIGIVVVALGFAYLAKVPTYSAGPVVVTVDGLDVTAPAPGTVDRIHVRANDRVAPGDELARLYSAKEQADLEAAETSYRDALLTFLVDNGDEGAKQKLAAASTQRQTARAVIETRTIRAGQAGVVSDVRVRPGQNLNPGDHILTIVPEGADPVVVALLPGQDRPRLRVGQTLQVELKGFIKPRERVVITEVGAEVIGPNEARRALGAQFADSVKLTGPVVLVRARLTRRTFEAKDQTYHFHNGLHGNGEVLIDEKPFLVTLLPAVEKLLY